MKQVIQLLSLTLSSARDVHKVTIVPRDEQVDLYDFSTKEDQMLSSKMS